MKVICQVPDRVRAEQLEDLLRQACVLLTNKHSKDEKEEFLRRIGFYFADRT